MPYNITISLWDIHSYIYAKKTCTCKDVPPTIICNKETLNGTQMSNTHIHMRAHTHTQGIKRVYCVNTVK